MKQLSIPPEHARRIIAPYQNDLGSIPRTAWAVYHDEYARSVRKHDPITRANIIWSEMVHAAKLVAAELGFKIWESSNRHFFVWVEDAVAVRFKKLNARLLTSNYPTDQAVALTLQQLDLFENEYLSYIVDVGYIPNATWTNFESIHIVLSSGETVHWEIRLDGDLRIISDLSTDDLFKESDNVRPVKPKRVRAKEPGRSRSASAVGGEQGKS